MNKKLFYETPDVELISVRFEENLLTGSVDTSMDRLTGSDGAAGYNGDKFDGNSYNL